MDGRQASEVAIAADVLNRMLELGRLEYVRTPISVRPVSLTIGKAGSFARLAGTKGVRYPRSRWVNPMPGA